jgi:pyridinium-3,5-bisthiocarboxylic acid mononucleotide nickel chelatase
MKTLYLDCGMGAAGDMLTAALWELLPDREGFLKQLNALGLPGVTVSARPSVKCGVTGTHFEVLVDGEAEEEHAHSGEPEDHAHDGEHGHHHHAHRGMAEIGALVDALALPAAVKADVRAVYAGIADAESRVHGVPVAEIHFHELGTMDALADIAAACLAMAELAPGQVIVSPVRVGFGQVRCAHGLLPVPAPAAALLLEGVPVYAGEYPGEFCTPTGAALLRHFASRFGPMPVLRVERIGYGMGKKDFEAANCVRALLGETDEAGDTVSELSCNLDDMTPEAIGFAQERLFDAGALEVYTTAVGMKKSRPGVLLTVMCREAQKGEMVKLLFRHTTTLGVRESVSRRYTLARESVTDETALGPVRRKIASGWGVRREKFEYEDLARAARERGCSLDEARRLAEEK